MTVGGLLALASHHAPGGFATRTRAPSRPLRLNDLVRLRVVPGSASRELSAEIAARLRTTIAEVELERFPDGEIRPCVDATAVAGEQVLIVQSTGPPVAEHLVELLLLADACRRAGAAQLMVMVPYLGYARQDRRSRTGEALGARVVADTLHGAGVDRLVVVDPHTPALEAIAGLPVTTVSAADTLARAVQRDPRQVDLVVAPDLGAAKLARRFGGLLDVPIAIVHKTRLSGTEVEAHDIVGDVRGRRALVVDDMISTGGTIEAAQRALTARGAEPEVTVAATHGLLVERAIERFTRMPLRRLLVTDTVMAVSSDLPIEVCSMAAALSEAIRPV